MKCHLLLLGALTLASPKPAQAEGVTEPSVVVTESKSEDGTVRSVWAQSTCLIPVTVTFKVEVKNMTVSPPSPITVSIPTKGKKEVFTARITQPKEAWNYHYDFEWMFGERSAVHDPGVIYALPYPAGRTYEVAQGFHGRFSHTGDTEYAIDFRMPVGSPVCAARSGLVVRTQSESDVGGTSREKFFKEANYIMVAHDDGTIGAYFHLRKDGVAVAVDDRVKVGQVIGFSGNTGFTSEPHLHFHVAKPIDGFVRETLPIVFRTTTKNGEVLAQGEHYTSP